MKIILSHRLDIISPQENLLRKICDNFTLENPEWLENHKMRRWQGRTDHWLRRLQMPLATLAQRRRLNLPMARAGRPGA